MKKFKPSQNNEICNSSIENNEVSCILEKYIKSHDKKWKTLGLFSNMTVEANSQLTKDENFQSNEVSDSSKTKMFLRNLKKSKLNDSKMETQFKSKIQL